MGIQFKLLLFMVFSLSQPFVAHGSEEIRFEQEAVKVGTSIFGGFLIDSDGFLWVGTTGLGVLRYDGNELKSFANRVHGLTISAIAEDQKGVLWFASFDNGITSYDKNTGRFTLHKHNPNDPNSIASNNISFTPNKLFIDKANTIWVGTDEAGLCEYNSETGIWIRHKFDPQNNNSLSDNRIMAIAEDKDGFLWIGTQNGLNRLDRQTNTWTRYIHQTNDPSSLRDNWINSLLVDSEGILWIGTKTAGLGRLNRNNVFSHYSHDPHDSNSISSNNVWSILESSSGKIWVSHMASTSSGLDEFDKESRSFTRYGHDMADQMSVSSNSVTRVYEDEKTKTLWVVNHNGFIDKQDKSTIHFKRWKKEPGNPNSLSDNAVIPILEDNNKNIWVGTVSGGLNRIDRNSGKVTQYQSDPKDPLSIPRNRVTAIQEDSSGVLWLGFWDGILASFDRATGKCIRIYNPNLDDQQSIPDSERLKYIIEDKDDPNILWLATIKGGLNKLDKRSGIFEHFEHNPKEENSLSHNSIVTIYDNGKGFLWLATYGGGLDRFEKKSKKFHNFSHEPGNPNSLGSNTLYEVLETSEGKLWIARKGGISQFDPVSSQFQNFDKDQDGIQYGVISSLLQDDNGTLWLGTVGGGIVQFYPKTGETTRFTIGDGLTSNTVYWTSRLKTEDGKLWFGGSDGISSFYPLTKTKNKHIPPVKLTQITQGGSSFPIESAPEKISEINLDWRNNYFEFSFAALDFTAPEKNQYAYKLEGWDPDWYYSGAVSFGRYSGLTGGKYILRLKGSNNDGLWNEVGTSIVVNVKLPFWETFWFKLTVLVSGIVTLLFVLFYTRKLKSEIIERKQAENALRASEERFKAIYEHAPVLIDAFDKNGQCVLWNNECRKTFGWTIEEINAHGDALSLFYPDPDVREKVIRTVTTNPDTQFREWHPRTKDGKILDTMWVNFALPDGLSFNLGYDITSRKELESRLLQAQKMESIGNFAGGIAHDFNNILSSVMGFTELALDNAEKNSPMGEDLQEVYSAGLRAKELVQQILTFARQSDEELKPIQIDITIKEVIKFLRSTIPTTIEIKYDIESQSAIIGNATQIHRIMMNLCTNAVDAMEKDGGTLEITLKDVTIDRNRENPKLHIPSGNYIELKVSDTGDGIERHLIDKIFDPYFTTKGQSEGTGLGLAMVHGIVETYGGGILVDSVPSQGTAFTIFLPAVKRRTTPLPENSNNLPTGQETILLVDDEAPITKMTSRLLRQLGYTVTVTTNGLDALELFKSDPDCYDLIISDVTMPNMSGDQLAKKLMEIRLDIPVILSTGYSKRLSEKEAFDIGVRAFTYKPIEKAELAKTVRRVLDS